jgi:Trypsin-like peptidase domain
VAKVVICPSCQAKGSVPDGAQVAKIRCPKCGQTFDVKAATQSQPSSTGKKSAGSKASATAAFGDLDNVQPLPTATTSGVRRVPGAGRQTAGQGSGPSAVTYVALGIGGLAVVMLGIVLVVLLSREANNPKPQVAAAESTPEPAPAPQPVAAPPVTTPTATVADTSTSSSPSLSEATDSVGVVRRLKDATVYLKHTIGGRTLASGTGFVIAALGDMVFLATNRHVAVIDLDEIPPSLLPKGTKPQLEAVFRSGQGAQQEQTLPVEILAADTSDEFSTDLAILAVRKVKRPPTPVNINASSDTTEGMAYTGAGFPLGGMLAKITDSKGNPSVTITRGGIGAVRRDDYGQIELYQVDGSLQPGNSGGPIVEEKTGKLIGVAVAKVGAVDTIGFVVPAETLRKTLAGRVGALDLTLKGLQKSNADLEIKAHIVDPKGTVQSVLVHAASASTGKVSPNSDGTWPPLPNTTAVELKREGRAASGVVQVALAGEGAAARKILIQTAHRDQRGQLVYSKPREIDLPEKPGRVLVSGQMLKILKTIQRKTLSMLGQLVDPEKDCKLTKDEDNMKIKIEIPGGKVRSLAPYVVTRLNKKKPLHNAPMALIDVEGDFAALVEVTGEWSPGTKLPKDRQGNEIPFTFNGAGLLLYQDKDNFVRFERSQGVAVDSLQPIHKVLFEVVKDGHHVENQSYPQVPEGPVYLLIMRRKGRVVCGASLNMTAPPVPIKTIELDLPSKVKIGLSASNISAKPFTAQFENFALINSETQLDAMFGDGTIPEKKSNSESKSE